MSRYRVTFEARSDLRDIKSYLMREAGPRVARQVLGEIKVAMQFLGERPGVGHIREDLTAQPLQFWSVYSYLIIIRSREATHRSNPSNSW